VRSEEEALRLFFAAESARTTAQHALNVRSNRAHAIFTVHVQRRDRLGGGRERIVYSKLHTVDLAGSERIKKTLGSAPLGDSPLADLQRESLAINKSLACLESCVAALAAAHATSLCTPEQGCVASDPVRFGRSRLRAHPRVPARPHAH
jgi:hypothetical protein